MTGAGKWQSFSARHHLLLAGLLVAMIVAVAATLVVVSGQAATLATENNVDRVAAGQLQKVPNYAGSGQPRVNPGTNDSGAADSAVIVLYHFDAKTAKCIAVYGAMTPSGPLIEESTVLPSSAPCETNTTASSRARTRDDVLSVEWLAQYRQRTSQEPRDGDRAAQPLMDNYIGFIE